MPEDRRHAAIMFTDIVGYTALMGSNEDKAFAMLKQNHEIHETYIRQFNGILIKEIGDGTLASFSLASDAVRCALEIQNICKEQKIPLKIGIHEGEMVFAGADVLGDGVNIASRLQESAEEGCITISGSVYRDIKNKAGIKTEFLEEKSFKNVDEPIKVYRVIQEIEKSNENQKLQIKNQKKQYPVFIIFGIIIITLIIVLWRFMPTYKSGIATVEDTSKVTDKSIAVLPFTDMSPEQDQGYFCDGMMEEILMHLYKVGGLRVISRTSAMEYKNTNKNIREIARELGVAHILEGSIRKSGNNLRITVQLIDTTQEQHLWAESYDRNLSDIFSIQSDVAQQIAAALKTVISPEVKQRIENVPTENLSAYDYYLKGNDSYWNSWAKGNKKFLYRSIDEFEKAIELDDKFSLAFTGLGRTYWLLSDYEPLSEKSGLLKKSKINLQKAIELDPNNGWAYAEMAVALMYWDWDSTAIRSDLNKALELMPNDQNGYIHYFWFELRLGNCDRMLSIMQAYKRFNVNVDQPFSYWNIWLLLCQKDYSEIARICDNQKIEDINWMKVWPAFYSYLFLHQYQKADGLATRSNLLRNKKSYFYYFKGLLEADKGNEKTALALCDSLRYISTSENVSNLFLADIYARLGDRKEMYYYLNEALACRESYMSMLILYPSFDPYRNESQFRKIVDKMWVPVSSRPTRGAD